jgi:hypothetical protein
VLKLVVILAAFVVWMAWALANPGWGIPNFVWLPAIGAAVTVQLMILRFLVRRKKEL